MSEIYFEKIEFLNNQISAIKAQKSELQGINERLLTEIQQLKAVQEVSMTAYETEIAKLKADNIQLSVQSLNNPPEQYTSAKTLAERLDKDAFIKTLEMQNERLREQINRYKGKRKKVKKYEQTEIV